MKRRKQGSDVPLKNDDHLKKYQAHSSPKRSREIMPNNSSLPYPIPSLFASPRLFVGFSPKGFTDSETSMSPTSPLETKHFSTIDHHKNQTQRSTPIGLGGLADILHNETQTGRKSFLQFRSQLKIQVPSVQPNSLSLPSPPQSPIEFGVETKDSQLALHSPLSLPPTPLSSFSPELLTDMELSEDYTCVISHGPNPKTTHIFDNFIVESCCGNGGVALRKENYSADGFLSFCHGCKKNLSQGMDIFMYRGEKAFCSKECRHRQMLLDEGDEKFSQDLSDLL